MLKLSETGLYSKTGNKTRLFFFPSQRAKGFRIKFIFKQQQRLADKIFWNKLLLGRKYE